MAAVNVDRQDYHNADFAEVWAQIDIANTGDTWDTGLRSVFVCGSNDSAITKMAPGTGTSAGIITLTSTGAVQNALVWAKGSP